MWQLEWMISLIPVNQLITIIHAITIIGIVGLVLTSVVKIIPFVNNYAGIAKPIFLLLLLFGVYNEGRIVSQENNIKAVAEYTEKVEEAKVKSEQVNTVIETKYVDRIKIVKEKADASIQYIEKVVTKYDNKCELPNAVIVLHDSASKNGVPPSSGNPLEGATSFKVSDFIGTVVENYATYYQIREQVIGWQEWYREQKRIFESVK